MKVHHVAADNQCLFNAIAYGMLYLKYTSRQAKTHYKVLAKKLRHYAVKEMEDHLTSKLKEQLALEWIVLNNIHLKNDITNEEKIEFSKKYIDAMKQKNTWGGLPEIHALSKYVHDRGFKGIKVFDDQKNEIKGMKSKTKSKNKYPFICLILHGTSLGGVHYDYLSK